MSSDARKMAESALRASERVRRRAKAITNACTNRTARARTEPFAKVELHDEDSLVTSIDQVIASAVKPVEEPEVEVLVVTLTKE